MLKLTSEVNSPYAEAVKGLSLDLEKCSASYFWVTIKEDQDQTFGATNYSEYLVINHPLPYSYLAFYLNTASQTDQAAWYEWPYP